jgi:hypothetical protein
MRTLTTTSALLGLVLAGCSGQPDAVDESPANAGGTISYRQQLEAMPEGQRNAVFIRAIRDAGQGCQHVDSSTSTGNSGGMPVWSVRCSGGGTWSVVVGENGVAQVVDAASSRLILDNEAAPAATR